MSWVRELVDGIGEIRDLREAVALTTKARDVARTEAAVLRWERDQARITCTTLAETNVRLAQQLEWTETLLAGWRKRWEST